MLHSGMKSVKLRLLTLLILFSDSLFTFAFLLNSDKHLLLTELLFLAFMITGIGITVYPCPGLSKFYVVTITHLRADHIHWKCKVQALFLLFFILQSLLWGGGGGREGV